MGFEGKTHIYLLGWLSFRRIVGGQNIRKAMIRVGKKGGEGMFSVAIVGEAKKLL